jgi:hypothetical protein
MFHTVNPFFFSRSFLESTRFYLDTFALKPNESQQAVRNIQVASYLFLLVGYSSALYASLRKSIPATKIALGVWCLQMGCLAFMLIFLVVFYLSINEETRRALPPIDSFAVFVASVGLFIQFTYGWSLLVMLRDIRGQPRDAQGRLVGSSYRIAHPGPIRI